MNNTYYIYREVQFLSELRDLFHVRYNAFRTAFPDLYLFGKFSDVQLELDQFDLYAQHFGLFRVTDGVLEAVGYRRIVSEKRSPMCEEIRIIASVSKELSSKLIESREYPLPLMMYHPKRGEIYNYYLKAKSSGLEVVEASRSSLDPSLRSISLAKFFFASAFATGLVDGVDEALITCIAEQKRFYEIFGFSAFAGINDCYCSYVGKTFSTLSGSPNALPSGIVDVVNKMAEAYRITGRICYNPISPDNYYAPLGSYHESKPVFVAA